ncbi:MAG TPA: DUF4199 domain-containing protein [Gemmatimonadaceae bacterium]|nr:DUF4199 domain-containing protein [Gemmatimonadaceae bacterium]
MKRTIWKFGLYAGGVMSVLMLVSLPFEKVIGYDLALVVGYTSMVLAFLFIFFGVRSYRDAIGQGAIGFGRALAVGSLIAVVASVCYTATWEVIYYWIAPDFAARYEALEVNRVKTSGASQQEIDKRVDELKHFSELYKNPAVNIAYTLIEPLPVGLVIALVTAGVLRRRPADAADPSVGAAGTAMAAGSR